MLLFSKLCRCIHLKNDLSTCKSVISMGIICCTYDANMSSDGEPADSQEPLL